MCPPHCARQRETYRRCRREGDECCRNGAFDRRATKDEVRRVDAGHSESGLLEQIGGHRLKERRVDDRQNGITGRRTTVDEGAEDQAFFDDDDTTSYRVDDPEWD